MRNVVFWHRKPAGHDQQEVVMMVFLCQLRGAGKKHNSVELQVTHKKAQKHNEYYVIENAPLLGFCLSPSWTSR